MLLVDPERIKHNEDSAADVKIEYVGRQRYPVLVVDNFYLDPEYVRGLALDLHYSPVLTSSYPGEQAIISLPMTELYSFIYRHIGKLYGLSKKSTMAFGDQILRFSLIRKHEKPNHVEIAHIDPTLLQILIYLTPSEKCLPGTLFKRHKEYDIDEHVFEVDTMKAAYKLIGLSIGESEPQCVVQEAILRRVMKMGLFARYFNLLKEGRMKSFRDMQLLLDTARDNYHLWEAYHSVEMKFNRLVCFPGFLFHAPSWEEDAWDGERKEEYRLTQNCAVTWPFKSGKRKWYSI
ncbi:MAG: hypothetical protein ACI9S8_001148 [Chlamydiales bacterium]|jgi:hypothetical protein